MNDSCEAKGEDVYTTTVTCKDPDDVIVESYSTTGPVWRYMIDMDGTPSSQDAYKFSGVRLKCSNTGQYARSTYIKTNVLCANPFDICGQNTNDRCTMISTTDTSSVGPAKTLEVKASCPHETTAWAIGLSCVNSNSDKFEFSSKKILNDGESWPSAAACTVKNKVSQSHETTVDAMVQCVNKDHWEDYTRGYL
ncbi:MAG: hypothetical protein SGARI_005635 [Bacillariaceae sp.]